MLILILLLTVIFTLVGFIGNIPDASHLNPFIQYIFLQLEVFLDNPAIFLVTILGIFGILFTIDKTPLKHKRYGPLFVQTIFSFIISFFCSFVLLFFVAWLQLNILSISLHKAPRFVGVTNDVNTITNKLKAFSEPPQIIATDNDAHKELVAIAMATTGTSSFYGNVVLSALPRLSVFPIEKSSSSMLLLDNTLIVTRLDRTDLTKVSPIIGYLYAQRYFPTRALKTNPKVSVMTTQEFASYRKQDAKNKLQQLTADISLLQTEVSSLSATIQQDTDAITQNQKLIHDTYATQDDKENQCIAAGTVQNGKFVRTYPDSYCKNLSPDTDTIVAKANNTIDKLTTEIQTSKAQQSVYKQYVTFFTAQQKVAQVSQANIPYELGVFVPKNGIQLVLDETSVHEAADYFETLTHEYFHFASYQEKSHFASSFFEEGLTEYFARQAIQDELNTSTNLGYPVFVKIIAQMTKRIPESELADIYFSKDEQQLEATLNRVYGDNFYSKNYPYFQALLYTAEPKQTLQIANTIMKHIGGVPLTNKDLYSTTSNL